MKSINNNRGVTCPPVNSDLSMISMVNLATWAEPCVNHVVL